MDNDRFKRWVHASHKFGRIEPFFSILIQNLGRVDSRLVFEDSVFLKLTEEQMGTIECGIALTDRMTLSYLWVLGGYEFVRTLAQRLAGQPFKDEVVSVKHAFNRLRIPLAKFEAASRSPDDSPIAYPAINSEDGIAWQLGRETFITRLELSNQLLDMVERYEEQPQTPE